MGILFGLTFFAIIGCGLIGGLLFVFSNSVMKALGQQSASHGMAAMQAINRTIVNPLFLLFFMGTAVVSLFLLINAYAQWYPTHTGWMIAGSMFYLVGTFGMTVVVHVPWNNELEKADPTEMVSEKIWDDYRIKWTRWNHVRTIAAFAAAASYIFALP